MAAPFKVTARGDFERLARRLGAAADQVPFATAMALTRTAQKVKAAERDEMVQVFDRPVSYTLNSLKLTPARKTRLRAEVWFREFPRSASEYLGPQIFGGERRLKRSEWSFGKKTNAKGKYFMPGKAIKMGSAGNVNRGTIVQIISDMQLFRDTTQNRNPEEKKGQYFIGTPGDAPLGVWRRDEDGGVSPMFIAVDQPRYKKRLRFFEVGGTVARRELLTEFDRAVRQAMASRR